MKKKDAIVEANRSAAMKDEIYVVRRVRRGRSGFEVLSFSEYFELKGRSHKKKAQHYAYPCAALKHSQNFNKESDDNTETIRKTIRQMAQSRRIKRVVR